MAGGPPPQEPERAGLGCVTTPAPTVPLDPEELRAPAEEAAPALLGRHLRSTVDGRTTRGRIVEVEAYIGPHDPASHAAERIGRTDRNEAMFGAPGTAYVYLIYGVHWCLNVVTGEEEEPAAVLVRALEPLEGLETMAERRSGRTGDLASGPGRLCQALGVTGGLNGHELDGEPLELLVGEPVDRDAVQSSGRVGVTRAAEWPLRYFVRESPHVSRARVSNPRGRPAGPVSD